MILPVLVLLMCRREGRFQNGHAWSNSWRYCVTESISRRDLLKLGAAGMAAPLMISARGAASSSLPSSKVVVGVMGMGGRGTTLATGMAAIAGVEVAYVCDVDSQRMAAATEAVGKVQQNRPRQVVDFRRMLDDRAVDAIVIATADHWHAPAAIMACAAGKHVYVEKPCSHNAREGELLVDAAARNKRLVQHGTQRRSYGAVREAIERLRDGVIGRVYYSRAWMAAGRPSIGRGKPATPPDWLDYELWQGPAPRVPYRDNIIHYNWHWFWHWGTGELGNHGIHRLDICRLGLDVDYPTHVSSAGGRYHYEDDQETPDVHVVAYNFEGGKTLVWENLSSNRYGPDGTADGITFHGDQGTLAIHGANYEIFDKDNNQVASIKGQGGPLGEHLANFVAAIREEVALLAPIVDGHKSTLLCHLGNIAYRRQRSLSCDPSNGHILNDDEAQVYWEREYEPGWKPII